MDMTPTNIGIIAGAAVVSLFIGTGVGSLLSRMKKKSATNDASRIRQDAEKEATHIQREAKVAAKSEILQLKEECEDELNTRRKEMLSNEKRLAGREETLNQRADSLEGRIKQIDKREHDLQSIRDRLSSKEQELQRTISKQIDELQRVADLDRETARKMILEKLEGEVRNECGLLVRNLVDEAKEKAEKQAREVLTCAIQRYSSDCTYERTTATIPLPSDEMKGRIIGREGRNIRALEAATGVSILIDDTPEAVVISCFDPVRKEIARQLMERLISDGRIHPTRIEELAKKVEKEVEKDAFSTGEAAVLEVGIQGVSPQVIRLLGRMKFRYSFSQNVLQHSLECAYFMGIIAAELGLDEQKAKRIGLFHDLGKAVDHEVEGSHAAIGAEILRKNREADDVINAVAAHHEEVEAQTVYATLIQACDTLSASRPGARSETTELYLKRLEQLEDIAISFDGVENCFALQAGREVRVVINPERIKEGEAQVLARDICNRIEQEMNYPGQIRVTIIRETRSIEFAK
jgi:ribonucrease Y